jgi:hypothetical protein
VGQDQLGVINVRLGRPYAALRLQAADREAVGSTDQPIAGRHRRSVVEQRVVADDSRITRTVANHHHERTLRRPAKKRRHPVTVPIATAGV